MVGRLSARTQDQLLTLLVAAAEGRGDEAADVLIDLGQRRELIVAAALIMQVPATFRLLGYRGLAMILFVVAAGAGAMLAIQVINHDRSSHRPRT
jgi:hypothetical protein